MMVLDQAETVHDGSRPAKFTPSISFSRIRSVYQRFIASDYFLSNLAISYQHTIIIIDTIKYPLLLLSIGVIEIHYNMPGD